MKKGSIFLFACQTKAPLCSVVAMGLGFVRYFGVFCLFLTLVMKPVEAGVDFNEILRSVVKVEFMSVGVFTREGESGHGTGFIMELGSKTGLLFTNNHVVETNGVFSADQVELSFNVPEEAGNHRKYEKIKGEVVFRSHLYDLAFIEFQLRDLKRARKHIRAFPKALSEEESKLIAIPRRPVMAVGFPFESENSFTEGIVNTTFEDDTRGRFIQTSAPINPGNSGGPLLDLETGAVLGINTEKYEEADNMGFAIPIHVALKELEYFRKRKDYASPKSLPFTRLIVPEETVEDEGLTQLIEGKYPGFFSKLYDGVLAVDNPGLTGLLQSGDYVLAADGQTFGRRFYRLRELVTRSESSQMRFSILRAGKFLEVDVPLIDSRRFQERLERNFVLVSGMLITELKPQYHHFASRDQSRALFISEHLPHSPAEASEIRENVILVAIELNGERHALHSIKQLSRILKGTPEGTPIRYYYREPATIRVNDKLVRATDRDGYPVFVNHPAFETIPFTDFVTSQDFDLKSFRNQFDFTGRVPSRVDWRRAIKTCSSQLAKSQTRSGKKLSGT